MLPTRLFTLRDLLLIRMKISLTSVFLGNPSFAAPRRLQRRKPTERPLPRHQPAGVSILITDGSSLSFALIELTQTAVVLLTHKHR